MQWHFTGIALCQESNQGHSGDSMASLPLSSDSSEIIIQAVV